MTDLKVCSCYLNICFNLVDNLQNLCCRFSYIFLRSGTVLRWELRLKPDCKDKTQSDTVPKQKNMFSETFHLPNVCCDLHGKSKGINVAIGELHTIPSATSRAKPIQVTLLLIHLTIFRADDKSTNTLYKYPNKTHRNIITNNTT